MYRRVSGKEQQQGTGADVLLNIGCCYRYLEICLRKETRYYMPGLDCLPFVAATACKEATGFTMAPTLCPRCCGCFIYGGRPYCSTLRWLVPCNFFFCCARFGAVVAVCSFISCQMQVHWQPLGVGLSVAMRAL